ADGQTAGRGRRGRTWSSPPGQGVWCSLIVRPALRPWEWPRLVAWASLAVVRTGASFVPWAAAGVEWPHGLLAAGRQRAGIRRLVLESLLQQLWAVYREEAPACFRGAVDRLRPCSLTLGRRVRVEGPAGAVEGVAVDLTPDGLLQVRDDGGVLHTIPSGDVSP